MYRRLYFLIPDRIRALAVIDDLLRMGIDRQAIEALADPRTRTDGLPQRGCRHGGHNCSRLEKFLWNSNLISFTLAFGCLIFLLITRNLNWWLLAPPGVMAVNFITGLKFSNTPKLRLGEFRDALAHGEILLLVEVPESRAPEIERRVYSLHPETASGTTGWVAEEAFGH